MTDWRMQAPSIRPEEAEWLDATRLLLALATRKPTNGYNGYNTVPEAARGLLGFAATACRAGRRAEIEELRAVAHAARDIVRASGRADLMSILEERLRVLD